MPSGDFPFGYRISPYASVDKRQLEQYVNGEVLNHPKPGTDV